MRRGKRTLSCFLFSALFALSACASGQGAVSENPDENAAAGAASSIAALQAVRKDATKLLRLGSSPYAVQISRAFYPARISNEDWEDDMVACYQNNEKFIDFAVYQFSKEGYPDTLEEFTKEEAEEYEASEVATDETVNGIRVGRYRSVNEYGSVYREGMTYVFENDDEYIELDFWLIGYQAEEEMRKIVNSLTVVESEILSFGGYQIRIPKDMSLVSGAGANPAVYRNETSSLFLYVSRFPANETTLTDFVRDKGGSDIETDAEINGIPVAFYRAMEPFDGAFRNTLTCVLDDGAGFTALTFRLDGITAEAEAEKILSTLTVA
ncbi:MAG: hypothetical protein IKN96_04700 [Oscillibacter sp.]|nr:hypothetical protein [Oscillibacter sp.]